MGPLRRGAPKRGLSDRDRPFEYTIFYVRVSPKFIESGIISMLRYMCPLIDRPTSICNRRSNEAFSRRLCAETPNAGATPEWTSLGWIYREPLQFVGSGLPQLKKVRLRHRRAAAIPGTENHQSVHPKTTRSAPTMEEEKEYIRTRANQASCVLYRGTNIVGVHRVSRAQNSLHCA